MADPDQMSDQAAIEKRRRVADASVPFTSRPVEVIPLMREIPDDGGTMVLLSLQRWTTAFAINWFFAADDPEAAIDQRLQDGLDWSATDDMGRRYEGADIGGGGGNSSGWRMTTWFAPPLTGSIGKLTAYLTNPLGGDLLEAELPLRYSV